MTKRLAVVVGTCALALAAWTSTAFASGTLLSGSSAIVDSVTACGVDQAVIWSTSQVHYGRSYLSLVDPGGQLDASFGSSGDVHVGSTAAVGCGADGSIVVATPVGGGVPTDGPTTIERLLPTGALDSSFGSAGGIRVSYGVSSINVTQTGMIVLSGSANIAPSDEDSAAIVARLDPDGSPDTSFGIAGVYTATPGSTLGSFNAAVVLPDGSVTALEEYQQNVASSHDPLALHLTPSGVLDTTWGDGGYAIGIGGARVVNSGLAIDATGRIYAERVTLKRQEIVQMLRLDATGQVDDTWGRDGLVSVPIADQFLQQAAAGPSGFAAAAADRDLAGAPTIDSLGLTAHGAPRRGWPQGIHSLPSGLRSAVWSTTSSGALELIGFRTTGAHHQRFVVVR